MNDIKENVSKSTYKVLKSSLEGKQSIDIASANEIANIVKSWAVGKGTTHYAHIFHPLTGYAAEKHDSFLSLSNGKALNEFSGSSLIQGEPDASSFPNGGLRGTHHARGYTAWDTTSPIYIIEHDNGATLYIPTIFISWTGESLDNKLPILKSEKALDSAAKKVLKFFYSKLKQKIVSTAGCEQEYFLIDENFYFKPSRPCR